MPPTQGQRPTGKTIQWSINSVHDQNYFDHAEGCANSDLELYSYSEGRGHFNEKGLPFDIAWARIMYCIKYFGL